MFGIYERNRLIGGTLHTADKRSPSIKLQAYVCNGSVRFSSYSISVIDGLGQ